MSFFSIRTNDQDSIRKILDGEGQVIIPGITWLFDKVEIDDLVFVVLSGDESKKEFPYSNGLKAIAKICEGADNCGPIGKLDIASRFRWLTATRSTVVQASKVHPGFCIDAAEMLKDLNQKLVIY